MHVGTTSKASKTEAIFFPPPGYFKPLALPPPEPPALSTTSLPLATKPTQESKSAKRKREDEQYEKSSATQPILLPDGGILTFTKHFKYLGNFISYSLRDDHDIEHRIV